MTSYPPPNSDFFTSANYNNAFFKSNISGVSYAYATNQYLARVGNPNSTALTTTFSGVIKTSNSTASTSTTSGAFTCTGGAGIVGDLYVGNLMHATGGIDVPSSVGIGSLGNIFTYGGGAITSAGLLTASSGISNTGTIVSSGAVSAPPTYTQNSQTFTGGWYLQYPSATLASYTQLNVPISAGGATTTTPIGVSITPISLTPIILLNFSVPFYTDVPGTISLTIYRSTVSLTGTSAIVNSNLSILCGTTLATNVQTWNVQYIDTPTITAGQTLYYTLWAKTVGGTASRLTIQSTSTQTGFINTIAQQLN